MGANRTRHQVRAAGACSKPTDSHVLIRFIFAALIAVTSVSGTSAWGGTTVASIDGSPVSSDDFIGYFKAYARSKLYHGGSPERLRELANEALDNLITDHLLRREAERRGVAGDARKVSKRMEEIKASYRDRPEWPEIQERLPQIEQEVRTDTQIEALKAQVTKVAKPSESDLRQFHSRRIELFTQPAAYDLDLILIGVPPSARSDAWKTAGDTATQVVADLRAGGSFTEIAARHSVHQTASLGGKLGVVHRGQLPEEAQAVVEKMQPNTITDPVRTLEGYAILRLNERIAAVAQPFGTVRDRVESIYQRETSAAQWTAFLKRLRATAKIETSDVAALVEEAIGTK